MKNGMMSAHSSKKSAGALVAFASAVALTLTPLCAASEENQEQAEPKSLQRLYKCLDKKILKLSQKKKKDSAEKVLSKCSKPLERWLELIPYESQEAFMAQLTESITFALLEAEKGNFVADDDSDN